jgi:hypothetical protein
MSLVSKKDQQEAARRNGANLADAPVSVYPNDIVILLKRLVSAILYFYSDEEKRDDEEVIQAKQLTSELHFF